MVFKQINSPFQFISKHTVQDSSVTELRRGEEGRLNLLLPMKVYFRSNRIYSLEPRIVYLSKEYDTLILSQ